MAEVMVDDVLAQVPGRPPGPTQPPITDISQWLERFAVMAAILATHFPGVFCLPGNHCAGEQQLRGKMLGLLRQAIQEGGPGP